MGHLFGLFSGGYKTNWAFREPATRARKKPIKKAQLRPFKKPQRRDGQIEHKLFSGGIFFLFMLVEHIASIISPSLIILGAEQISRLSYCLF
jgi:hypothetical protein